RRDGAQPIGHRTAAGGVVVREQSLKEGTLLPDGSRPPGPDLIERQVSQQAARYRLIDEDRDPDLATAADHRSVLQVVDEAEAGLHDVHRSLRVAPLDISNVVVGQPD